MYNKWHLRYFAIVWAKVINIYDNKNETRSDIQKAESIVKSHVLKTFHEVTIYSHLKLLSTSCLFIFIFILDVLMFYIINNIFLLKQVYII